MLEHVDAPHAPDRKVLPGGSLPPEQPDGRLLIVSLAMAARAFLSWHQQARLYPVCQVASLRLGFRGSADGRYPENPIPLN